VLITCLCYLRSSNDNILLFLYELTPLINKNGVMNTSYFKNIFWKIYFKCLDLYLYKWECDVLLCFRKQPFIALLFFYFAIHVTWHLLMFLHLFLRHWRHVAFRCSWPLLFACECESTCSLFMSVNNDYVLLWDSYLSPCCPSRIAGRGCFCANKKERQETTKCIFVS